MIDKDHILALGFICQKLQYYKDVSRAGECVEYTYTKEPEIPKYDRHDHHTDTKKEHRHKRTDYINRLLERTSAGAVWRQVLNHKAESDVLEVILCTERPE